MRNKTLKVRVFEMTTSKDKEYMRYQRQLALGECPRFDDIVNGLREIYGENKFIEFTLV